VAAEDDDVGVKLGVGWFAWPQAASVRAIAAIATAERAAARR
jgi:hypothetical protein